MVIELSMLEKVGKILCRMGYSTKSVTLVHKVLLKNHILFSFTLKRFFFSIMLPLQYKKNSHFHFTRFSKICPVSNVFF